jgi:hypothetical protein
MFKTRMIKTPTIKSLAAASIILLAATAGAAAGQSYSDTYVMKDVRSPPGHARSLAAKLADARACGASRDAVVSDANLPAALDCMNARGWAVARVVPNESARPAAPSSASDDQAASDEEAANEAAEQSWAATQQWTTDQENAAMAQVGADTEAQGIAQMDAALQAQGQQ